jgi:hypothetical protein
MLIMAFISYFKQMTWERTSNQAKIAFYHTRFLLRMLFKVGDRVINKYGAADGMKIERGN